MTEADDKIRCDACPVMCYIRPGMTGACDRYATRDGQLVRVDPHVLLDRTLSEGGKVVPFVNAEDSRRPGRTSRTELADTNATGNCCSRYALSAYSAISLCGALVDRSTSDAR